MSEKNNKNSVGSNIVWHIGEKWLCQAVSFVVSIVMSRIMEPKDYAVVVIVNAFISIFLSFTDGGFSNSLIQNKDADDVDYSTVFYTNIVLCSLLYSLIYYCSPLLASFFNEESLTFLLRIGALLLIISAVKSVENAYVSKRMIFKKFFFASLAGTIASAIVGIYLAIKGYGALALVMSSLVDMLIDTVFIWFTIDWRPKFVFSFTRLKKMFSYSYKLIISTLTERIYNKTYHLSIGKYYTHSELAYYEKGYTFTNKISDTTNEAISSVLFSAMSNKQEDTHKVKELASRVLKTNYYIMTPIFLGIAAIAEPLIRTVLTDKWIFAAPFLRIFCIMNALFPFDSINKNAMKALGRSDLLLKNETYNRIICIVILIFSLKLGVFAIAYGRLFSVVISVVLNAYPNKQLINYGLYQQIKDVSLTTIISVSMMLFVYLISVFNLSSFVTLIIQVVFGIIYYVTLSYVTKHEVFFFLVDIIKNRIIKI